MNALELEKQYLEKKVLAIDDDPFIRKMFHSMLEPKGFQVVSACNGAEGVAKALQFKPDVIFLDIMMPEVDGFKTLEMMRKMEQTCYIPIIIVTARADTRSLLTAIKLGANDFIAKPFTRTMIMRKVKYAIKPSILQDGSEGEAESLSESQETFINIAAYREMKNSYIYKFDNLFVKMIRYFSNHNKIELINLLEDIHNSCKTYEISSALSSLAELKVLVKNQNWDEVMTRMEKVYSIFKNLQEEVMREEEKAKASNN
ncbi:MAG: response regulator [Calditrichia bacterium]